MEVIKDETEEFGRGEEQRKRRSNSPVVSNSEDSSSVALSTEGAPKGKERDRKFEIGENLKKEDERNSRKRSEISMQDEIQQLALKKREILMKGKEPGLWKEEIQKSIEREIERRVRDALETPPLERMRRNKHRAKLRKMQMEKEFQDQQKYLTSTECGNYAQNLPSLRLRYPWNDMPSSAQYYDMQGAGLCSDADKQGSAGSYPMGKYGKPSRLADTVATASPTLQSLLEGTVGEGNDKEDDRDQVIADIKRKAYHRYTREGFKEALKRGKLKLKKIGNGKFMDKNGVILTADGPFWPPECGPLYPKQEHVLGVPEGKELLSSDVPQETRTVENQKTKWFRPWEGTQVVFASERLSKGTVPHTTPDGCSQSIVFESRFESGNLRQARRVGQFEYDLVLKTDLYTNRHTQWFYFRVQKMLPGVTYKFNIVNLLKKDSLYNHGMRPLFYSENLASTKGLGWHRVGHHITYSRNYNLSRNPLLHPEIAYYTLVWQMEFPEENDVCFLTHCYPFTFTDLCQHLDTICSDSERKKHIKREVMCESRAGNSCFLLTVSNFTDKNKQKSKKGVVVTARVHPGETNASWMMKGFLDFITSADSVANNLRKAFTFKIVPMLNPDGVIVGNYRCSLSARDLNRNFRHPKKQSFPTIWHTKTMLEEFGQETDVIAYCDLHGHSRKHNVFIYGCDQQGKEMDAATFLCQRLFPWLISKKAPDKFSFGGCKFQVRRCKESTGRVVMWRQMGITNSFTMEATFCGSKNIQREDNPRHFNTLDFQDMGRHFCEALLEYHKAQEDKSLHSEFILELTKVITHQVLTSRGLVPQNFNIFAKNLLAENDDEQGTTLQNNDERVLQNEAASPKLVTGSGERGDASPRKKKNNDTSSVFSKITSRTNSSKNHHSSKSTKLKKQQLDSKIRSKLEALRFFDSMDSETIQGCINLIHDLHVMSEFAESDTSDSDSASESEIPMEPGEQDGGSPGKREKHKKKKTKTKKKAASAQSDVLDGERSAKPRRKSHSDSPRTKPSIQMKDPESNSDFAFQLKQALQAIPKSVQQQMEYLTPKTYHLQSIDGGSLPHPLPIDQLPPGQPKQLIAQSDPSVNFNDYRRHSLIEPLQRANQVELELKACYDYGDRQDLEQNYTPHVNRYLHRSNNGIPMFSEERTQERAIKRLEAMRRMERERLEKEAHKILQDDEYARLIALTRELQKREAEVRFKLSSPPTAPLHSFPELTTRSAGANSEIRGMSSLGGSAPMPRKLQPVAGMKYLQRLSEQSGRNYQIGFHISKIGDEDHPTDPRDDPTQKRRSVTSLGSTLMYSSDGPSSPDLELSPKIYVDRGGILEDFEIPPIYQELEKKLQTSRQRKAIGNGFLTFDPFQGEELPSQEEEEEEEGHSQDLNNNNRAPPPQRSQSSLAYASSSANYFRGSRKDGSRRRFTNRQSELIKQKSAPSHIRESSQETMQRQFGLSQQSINAQSASHYLNSLTHPAGYTGLTSITTMEEEEESKTLNITSSGHDEKS
ncbi:uncharacterized protein [Apostichopus japonicus]|uniref:uncharacterized protein isoform X2 n=1 Tax=Stichopus japonicus TaxID=307972 RepID=UPI003AB3ED2F